MRYLKLAIAFLFGTALTGCTSAVMQDTDLGVEARYRQPATPRQAELPFEGSPELVRIRDRIRVLEEAEAAARLGNSP